MKGIVLAGGNGTRLDPLTRVTNKHLLPVYDKPLIYYPIATLMAANIREILIITKPEDRDSFRYLLGDGSKIGIQFSFEVQEEPKGIADALSIGMEFTGKDSLCLILGDNIFHGIGFGRDLSKHHSKVGASIYAYTVSDPERYGVVELDHSGLPVSIVEKPTEPKSQYAIPGLYFFDKFVFDYIKEIAPSHRNELEITEVLNFYLRKNALEVKIMPRGTGWLDCGTINSLYEASAFVRVLQERQGIKIACIEEVAWRMEFITDDELRILAKHNPNPEYSSYLERILEIGNYLDV